MKQCTKCGVSKPLDAFERHKKYKGGRRAQCTACRREYQREYLQRPEVKERLEAYYQRPDIYAHYREYQNAYNSWRRASINNDINEWTAELIKQRYDEQSGFCALCSVDLEVTGFHRDHIVPVARGGTNRADNLQLLCPPCNRHKGVN